MQTVEKLTPLVSGNQNMDKPVVIVDPYKKEDWESSSSSSMDEDGNPKDRRDIFESSVYWQTEKHRIDNANALNRAFKIKKAREKLMGQNQLAANFIIMKQKLNRGLDRIKPKMTNDYSDVKNLNQKLFLFKDPAMPTFENFISEYIEKTLSKVTESIVFDQFKSIQWPGGLPQTLIFVIK